MPAESLEEFVPEQEDEAAYTAVIAPPPPRTLLMGSALSFVVISFTTLAVAVAVNIRPVADVEAQPVPPVQSDTVPGRYLPAVPHEPDPVALPVAVVSPPPAAPAHAAGPDQPGPGCPITCRWRRRRVQPGQVPAVPIPEVPPIPVSADCLAAMEPVPDADVHVADVPRRRTDDHDDEPHDHDDEPDNDDDEPRRRRPPRTPPPVIQAPPPKPEPQPEPEYKPPALAPEPQARGRGASSGGPGGTCTRRSGRAGRTCACDRGARSGTRGSRART